ncbi:MAG: QueT transporter family protein [Anaerolineae bacterium]|nr:QueT transporter family protein [Anaerolineae bacterium]
MKEVITMWKSTKMIILVALSAAIYAVVLIAFKGVLIIIPGITELRPANVFPIIFGLMFGPAGAWGSAIGNLIGDFFGTLSTGSIGGFVGNFYLGFVAYKMWGALLPKKEAEVQNVNTWPRFAAYVAVSLLAAVACGVIIGWWLDLLGIVPFAFLASVISVNNFLHELVLGPPLLLLLYPPIKRWGLIWTDIMAEEDVPAAPALALGNILMWVGAIGGLVVGLLVSMGLAGQQLFGFAGEKGTVGVTLIVAVFVVLIIISGFLLGGREQFAAEEEEELRPAAAA